MDERWADDENDNKVMTVTTGTETLQDGSTKKTVVSYKTNEKGQKIKVTKVIRYYKKKVKVNKNVEKRKKMGKIWRLQRIATRDRDWNYVSWG